MWMLVFGPAIGSCAPLPRPVLGKEFVKRLLALETRPDAFYELIMTIEKKAGSSHWKNIPRAVFDDAMQDIRVTECPGRGGKGPLYLVTYKEDFDLWYRVAHREEEALANGSDAGDFYPPATEEERRRQQLNAIKGTPHLSKARLDEPIWRPELEDKVLIYIDKEGQVQWPHGGNNLGGKGSMIADINGDGVLERVDHENYGREHSTFEVLEVETIETTPRVLLAAVFNWHPDSADAANRWWYDVKKMPGDAQPAIVFGPQHGAEEGGAIDKPLVEYHWDKAAGRYTGPDGKPGDHVRRLDVTKPDEMWTKIEELRKENAVGYRLLAEAPPEKTPPVKKDAPKPSPGDWLHWPKYEHHSLAAMSDEDLFDWQYGGEPESKEMDDAWPPVVIPPTLRNLPPREAALALAEANRTKAHRKLYDLILVDEEKAVPNDGVLVLDVHPGWSTKYQEFILLNRKHPEWWMFTSLGYRSGPEWSHYSDTGGTLRWLAEVIAWLDRVRTVTRAVGPAEKEWYGVVWSDVTRAGITWQTQSDDRKALEYRCTEPQFAGRQWKGPYTRMVAQTLAVNLWMRFTSPWRDDKHTRLPVDDAVKALLPGKPRAFTGSERVMIKPAIFSAGYAGLKQFRPQLEALAEGHSKDAEEEQIVPASLSPFAVAALNELDHGDDLATLKSWMSDDKRLEGPWAAMRLRQIEEAASNPSPANAKSQPGTIPNEAEPVDETSEQLVEQYRSSFTKPINGGTVDEYLSNVKGDARHQLWALIKLKFDGSDGDFRTQIATAYTAGLRDAAQDDLAHLATASPREAEGTRYDYSGGENGGLPVDGRYHLARGILAVWEEPDALTRAKLLLLLGLKNADERRQIPGVFSKRIETDLLASAARFDARDRAKLIAFTRWCATDAVGRMDDYAFTKSQAEWLNRMMQKLKHEKG